MNSQFKIGDLIWWDCKFVQILYLDWSYWCFTRKLFQIWQQRFTSFIQVFPVPKVYFPYSIGKLLMLFTKKCQFNSMQLDSSVHLKVSYHRTNLWCPKLSKNAKKLLPGFLPCPLKWENQKSEGTLSSLISDYTCLYFLIWPILETNTEILAIVLLLFRKI